VEIGLFIYLQHTAKDTRYVTDMPHRSIALQSKHTSNPKSRTTQAQNHNWKL